MKPNPCNILFKDNGSITIFSAISMAGLVMFLGLLVDFARIMAFERMTEEAVHLSMQSVLSAYDETLYDQYGLFGRGGTDSAYIFQQVMEGNRGAEVTSKASFSMIRSSIKQVEVLPSQFLGQHSVLSRQVLEEMKYKAPIDFTIEVLEHWMPLSDVMKETDKLVDDLDEMQKLYQEREDLLEEVLSVQKNVGQSMRKSSWQTIILNQNSSIVNSFRSYASKVKHDMELSEEEEPMYTDEIEQYERRADKHVNNLNKAIEQLSLELSNQESKMLNKLKKSEEINTQMEQLYEELISNKASDGQSLSPQLLEMNIDREGLIRETAWFVQYEAEILEQVEAFRNALEQSSEWKSLFRELLGLSTASSSIISQKIKHLQEKNDEIKKEIDQYKNRFDVNGVVVKERENQFESSREVKKQIKEADQTLANKWEEANTLRKLIDSFSFSDEQQAQYNAVKKKYEQSMQLNTVELQAETELTNQKDSGAKGHAKTSTKKTASMFLGLQDFATHARDTIYTNEYIINRFNYFPLTQFSSHISSGSNDEVALNLEQQEVEYILYGMHHPRANLALAYSELFAFRFAIRTMEGLIESKGSSHPLLILSSALIYAIDHTIRDMYKFIEEGSAPLSKYAPIELEYRDYLRLFLILHGMNEQKKLSRMIAIIEYNTQLSLMNIPTAITANATVSMNLWFLPGIQQAIGSWSGWLGKVQGKSYETTKYKGLSY